MDNIANVNAARDKYDIFFLAEDTIQKLYLYLKELTGVEVSQDTMEVYIKEAFLNDLLNEIEDFYLIKATEHLCSDGNCEKNCGDCDKLEELTKKISKSSELNCE